MVLQRVTEHPKHGSPGTANYIDARTTWFDQAVQGATQQGLAQVVVIAAGFDSRAYRLHAPGVQVQISCHILVMLLPCCFLPFSRPAFVATIFTIQCDAYKSPHSEHCMCDWSFLASIVVVC